MSDSLKKSTTDAGNSTDQSSYNKNKKRNWIIAGLLLLLLLCLGILCNRTGKKGVNNSPSTTVAHQPDTSKTAGKPATLSSIPIPKDGGSANSKPSTGNPENKLESETKSSKQAATETKTGNPFDKEMVYVAGGTFQMGGDKNDDEKPIHSVTLSSYYIGRTEVTQAQWNAIMGNNPSNHKDCEGCPVENVSWNDIQTFLKKLNELTKKNYRLPTEAEWEFAARGGTQSKSYTYSGSSTLSDVAWFSENSGKETHPVGKKTGNELGIYDMSGNVWEWCADGYDKDYYKASPANNPKGPSNGSSSDRVYRGGAWGISAQGCRISDRRNRTPGSRYNYLGFRLALSQ